MDESSSRRRMIVTYVTFVMLFLTALFRALGQDEYTRADRVLVFVLLAVYGLLLGLEPFLSARFRSFLHGYFVVQTALTAALLLFPSFAFDYYAILIVPLGPLAVFRLPRKTALVWITTITLLTSICLLVRFDLLEALSYVVTYAAAMIFLTAYGSALLDAETATRESGRLLAELQETHRRLQVYAAQVEELAAAQERNRLARELHDSATQTVFSMTLAAQSARILLDRDPARVPEQLDRLQELAQSALAEMRSLIQQLRPRTLAEEGLAAALRRHAAERKIQDGLEVLLEISGDRRLPLETEEALFRVAQEALTNVVKHAGVRQAWVRLRLDDDPPGLEVEDQGVGFDPAQSAARPGHLGLASMAERIQNLGGTISIDSQPGCGTRIRVNGLRPPAR